MAQRINSSWQTRLTQRVKAEPKKAVVLGVLIVLMAGLWGKMMSKDGEGSGPASASAAIDYAAAAPTVSSLPLTPTKNSSDSFREWLSGRLPLVSRNLFAVEWDYFPQVASKSNSATPENFWNQLAKSMNSRAMKRAGAEAS